MSHKAEERAQAKVEQGFLSSLKAGKNKQNTKGVSPRRTQAFSQNMYRRYAVS